MRRLSALVHMLLALASLAAFATWLVGRVLTDRFLFSQYLYWIPSLALLALSAALAIGALLFGAVRCSAMSKGREPLPSAARPAPRLPTNASEGTKADRRSRRRPRRTPISAGLTRLALLGSLIIALHVALVEWRTWRYVFPPRPAPPGKSVLVLHWNMTVVEPGQWQAFLDAMPLDPQPDVIVLTNPIWSSEITELADRLRGDYSVIRIGTFGLATRFPIRSTAYARLGIGQPDSAPLFTSSSDHDQTVGELLPSWSPIPRVGGSSRDPGHIMCATLDTTAVLGRPLVVWGIDLPSDVRIPRYAAATQARRTIDALLSPSPAAIAAGTSGAANDAENGQGANRSTIKPLTLPDIIVGDFNTPRGSDSLTFYSRGYPHAFAQAGRGYMASWPRQRRGPLGEKIPNPFPIFQIDQTYVAPWLRAVSYELLDPRIAEHYVQRVRVTPR
ncbi:MAG: hypothetical protein AB7G11_15995 [Phycisphaerales bacterium]